MGGNGGGYQGPLRGGTAGFNGGNQTLPNPAPNFQGGGFEGQGNHGAIHHGAAGDQQCQIAGDGHQLQLGLARYQEQPKQLNIIGLYHVFTTSNSSRDRKNLQQAVSLSVSTEPAWPRWLNWSEQAITWSRADHPPRVENPGALALIIAPQVYGHILDKVLMDGGSSFNILYYETF